MIGGEWKAGCEIHSAPPEHFTQNSDVDHSVDDPELFRNNIHSR